MNRIILFSDNISSRFGGMEAHQEAFIGYYQKECFCLVVKHGAFDVMTGQKCVASYITLTEVCAFLESVTTPETIFFFNNLSWVREIPVLRMRFPYVPIVIRSGGNDVFKALAKEPDMTLSQKVTCVVQIVNQCVDVLIANSDYSLKRNRSIGIHEEKMVKVRGGVDTLQTERNILNREKNRAEFDQKYHTNGKFLLVIASRFAPFKGIVEYLHELRKAPFLDLCHLLLLGDGKEKQRILSALEQDFPLDFWTYLGAVSYSDAVRSISIGDVFVNFSLEWEENIDGGTFIHTETMGRSMMEAITQGIPLIAHNAGGTRELFCENDHIGYCLDSPDMANECLYEILSQGYQVKARSDYSWEKVFSDYNRLFELLLEEKHG